MPVEVVRVDCKATWKKAPKQMTAIVDFGSGQKVKIPIPAYYLSGDDVATTETSIVEGMESLAEALLRFADHIRKKQSSGHHP